MTTDHDALAVRRAAVEEELRQRLHHEAAARPKTPPASAASLQCLGCQNSNAIDAQFCTTCGARFNVRVLHAPRNESAT